MACKRLRAALVAACLFAPASGDAVELMVNGGFETGTFASWTVSDLAGGSGSFFITPNDGVTPPPLSGVGGALALNPAGGMHFALSDQSGPGTHALTQTFVVPAGATSVTFSFDMFLNDYSAGLNPTVDPSGLDHTSGGTGATNQHARVEILTAGTPPFSTAPMDVVFAALAPVPAPAAGVNP